LDLKVYEADMRHLIDSYIEADEPRTISPFDGMGLLDLIVNSGIADAIALRLSSLGGNQTAIAETIENNVRSKIIKGSLTDPAYFEKMSALLDEIIALRKAKAEEYEASLKRLVERVQQGKDDDTPERLDTVGKRAIYNSLKARKHHTTPNQVNENHTSWIDDDLYLALQLDELIRRVAPADWRGNQAKENTVKREALFPLLENTDEVEQIYPTIFANKEY
jgi:type I restriction enzyme R subunit